MGKTDKRKISGRGGRRDGRWIFDSVRGSGGQRNFNISNNINKGQDLNFYPHGNGPDRQTEMFTKVKEHLILNVQSEFMNVSDIEE